MSSNVVEEELTKEQVNDIVKKLEKIRNENFRLEYNVFDYITNDTSYYANSRCKEFAIYFLEKGKKNCANNGILIELVKGNIIISILTEDLSNDEIDIDRIISKFPTRIKEAVSKIKKLKKEKGKITKDFINDILITVTNYVYSKNILFVDNHNFLNSNTVFNFYELSKSKKHTIIYANFPILGKFNRKKRATLRKGI